MNNKSDNLKEKLKQALSSTAKVISGDFNIKGDSEKDQSSKKFDFFDIENLNSSNDFINAGRLINFFISFIGSILINKHIIFNNK